MTPEQIGEILEARGASDEEIDAYLEHHGVKGMHWGVRRARITAEKNARAASGKERFGNRNQERAQQKVDQFRRVASGKGTAGDKLYVGLFRTPVADLLMGGGIKGGAQNVLRRDQKNQKKIVEGKKRVSDALSRFGGVDVRNLDFSFKA